MAKNTDHLAGGLDTDNTGGVLSGLLAEEDDLDRRALWRLGSWGVGAVAAVILAVLANQTSLGWKRDQVAAADLTRQAQQIQQVAKETHSEARRLAAAIDTLNSDRDRLYTRVTTLEQGLDSMTGAIARQNSAAPPWPSAEPQTAQNPAPAPAVAPVASQAATSMPEKPVNTAATEPSPAMVSSVAKDPPKDPPKDLAKSDVPKIEGRKSSEAAKLEALKAEAAKAEAAKAEAAKADAARAEAAKTESAKTESAKAEAAKAEAARAEAAKAAAAKSDAARIDIAKVDVAKNPDATPATPLVAAKSFMAPPDPSAAKLIEPTKPISSVTAGPIPEVVAAVPASDAEADEETAPKVAVQRTQFGVDLGTANSVPGLRALWRGLLKSRSNAPLTALRPIIVIKEGTLGMQLRLVAGPLNDAGAAAKICAVLTENKRSCETAIFDGQRLSVTGEDPAPPPAASKPSPRRRGSTKRAAAVVVEEPPKKPEISTTTAISSWFGKKGQ